MEGAEVVGLTDEVVEPSEVERAEVVQSTAKPPCELLLYEGKTGIWGKFPLLCVLHRCFAVLCAGLFRREKAVKQKAYKHRPAQSSGDRVLWADPADPADSDDRPSVLWEEMESITTLSGGRGRRSESGAKPRGLWTVQRFGQKGRTPRLARF